MLCCILPLLLNIIPKTCLLVLFIYLVWFCTTAKIISFNISPLCPSAPLCRSSPLLYGLPMPPLKNHRLKTPHLSLAGAALPLLSNCHLGMHMSCLACSAPRSSHRPESHPKRPSPYGLSPLLPWGQWTIAVFVTSILISISMESG